MDGQCLVYGLAFVYVNNIVLRARHWQTVELLVSRLPSDLFGFLFFFNFPIYKTIPSTLPTHKQGAKVKPSFQEGGELSITHPAAVEVK